MELIANNKTLKKNNHKIVSFYFPSSKTQASAKLNSIHLNNKIIFFLLKISRRNKKRKFEFSEN